MEVANDRCGELVMSLFEAATLVIAYKRAAEIAPDCEGGWLRMAAKHGARANALLTEILGENASMAAAPSPRRFKTGTHGQSRLET